MEKVARLLNDMVDAGVIKNYAVFGAVAQMRYTEAVLTLDADILVIVPDPDALDLLNPIYAFCQERGYQPEGEAIHEAETGDIDGVPLRVVRADYLAVIALSVGRAKGLARILALREAGAFTDKQISVLVARHNLTSAWNVFLERFNES